MPMLALPFIQFKNLHFFTLQLYHNLKMVFLCAYFIIKMCMVFDYTRNSATIITQFRLQPNYLIFCNCTLRGYFTLYFAFFIFKDYRANYTHKLGNCVFSSKLAKTVNTSNITSTVLHCTLSCYT